MDKINIADPRLYAPQCFSLAPVEKVHENPWFNVFKRGSYFTVEYKQLQVLILPIVEKDSVVMVRVKRPIIADDTLELPAGGVKENETPVEAAKRELLEETGINILDPDRFSLQAPLVLTPRTPYLAHIFQIDLTREEFDKRLKHDDEIICVECFCVQKAFKMIENNQIYSGFQIAILMRFLLQQGQIKFTKKDN